MNKRTLWLYKGIDEVIEHGFEGFNIDILCTKMKVAKTSFYHFFESRENFLKELFHFWSTELLDDTVKSINNSTNNVNKFIRHKKTHIRFYCMSIQARIFSENKKEWTSIFDQVENKIWSATDGFIETLTGTEEFIDQTKTFIHTFLSGWDYLHAHNVYKNTTIGNNALKELKVFISNLKDNSSSQILAS